jgi:hypothetical protein
MARQRKSTGVSFAPGSDADEPLVLVASGGEVRGTASLVNHGSAPVSVPQLAIAADLTEPGPGHLGRAGVEPAGPMVMAPGSTLLVTVTATIDPRIPPGRYEAEVSVNGSRRPAVVQVSEEIELELSEREFVVAGHVGTRQLRTAVLTNSGNVALPVREIGPAELKRDGPERPLLERLGIVRARAATGSQHSPAEREDQDARDRVPDDDRRDKHRPTIVARLDKPLVVAPGDSVVSEWVITVDGPLERGVRYRATAPLYLSDVSFVVTPDQESPSEETSKPSRAEAKPVAATTRRRSRAATAPRNRRNQ